MTKSKATSSTSDQSKPTETPKPVVKSDKAKAKKTPMEQVKKLFLNMIEDNGVDEKYRSKMKSLMTNLK